MKMGIFSVHDAVAALYAEPFFDRNPDTAIRGFAAVCQQDGGQINQNAADYSLFKIGDFDAELGVITGHEPIKLCDASGFVGSLELREVTDA